MKLIGKSATGLDIADNTIEIASLNKNGQNYEISSLGSANFGNDIIIQGRIKDEAKLALLIKTAMQKANPKPITGNKFIFGLPESQTYSVLLNFNVTDKKELAAIIRQKAEENLPIEPDDLIYKYKIIQEKGLKEKDGKTKTLNLSILLVAVRKKVLREWYNFFKKNNFDVDIYDIETLAIFRGIYLDRPKHAVCIVDIGSAQTKISVFNERGLAYSYIYDSAGAALTRNIAEMIKTADGNNISWDEAEKLKIDTGLDQDDQQKKEIYLILTNGLRSIIKEIKTNLEYYYNKTNEEVRDIVLVGGGSKMKGILEFFESNLKDFNYTKAVIPTSELPTNEGSDDREAKKEKIADQADKEIVEGISEKKETIANDIKPENKEIKISLGRSVVNTKSAPIEYIEAIGLAAKALDRRWMTENPHFENDLISKLEKEQKKKKALKEEIMEKPGFLSWVKEHSKETQLISIVLLGAILIGGAFWYRGVNSKKMADQFRSPAEQFAYQKIFEMEIPVVTQSKNFGAETLKGKIISVKIDKAFSYDEALNQAQAKAAADLKTGEVLWRETLSAPPEGKKLILPIEINWLAYKEAEASMLYLAKIKADLKGKEFLLNTTEYISLATSTEPGSFMLKAKITVLTSEGERIPPSESQKTATSSPGKSGDIKTATGTDKAGSTSLNELLNISLHGAKNTSDENPDINQAVIKSTPTGWLNVRSGPGKENSIVAKVNSGESYERLGEENGWIRIKIDEAQEGWVSSEYVE